MKPTLRTLIHVNFLTAALFILGSSLHGETLEPHGSVRAPQFIEELPVRIPHHPVAADKKQVHPIAPDSEAPGFLRAKTELADHLKQLSVALVDGSVIKGSPESWILEAHTPYARLDLFLGQVERISRMEGEDSWLVLLANEQKVNDVERLAPLKLKTAFGDVTLQSEVIKKLQVVPADEEVAYSGELFPMWKTGDLSSNYYALYCVADFNGDGWLDAAVSDKTKGSHSLDVYLFHPNEGLVRTHEYPVADYPQHVVARDFNEDGHLDLMVTIYSADDSRGALRLFTGNGEGDFVMQPPIKAAVGRKGINPCRLAIDDLNRDGHLDVAVEMNNDWAVNVLWGRGDGTFEPKHSMPNGQNPGNTELVDLNQDGWLDIVSGSQYTSLFTHLSDGEGGYLPAKCYLKGTSRRQPIRCGDVDGDGDVDVLCANAKKNYISVMLNDESGTLYEAERLGFPEGVRLAGITDMNFDGLPDFVLSSGSRILVVPGIGDSRFGPAHAFEMGHDLHGLQLHDLNQDGRLDFVYMNTEQDQLVMRLNATEWAPKAQ